MKKYFAWAKTGVKNTLVYSSDFFLWGFNELLDTLVFLFIWMIIYGERNVIGGFTLSETITYLIGVGFIADIIASQMIDRVEKDVQDGKLSSFLIRPMDYFFIRFFGSFSNKPLNISVRAIVYLSVALFFQNKIIVNLNLVQLFLAVVSISLAVIINALFDFLIGCVSFWTITTAGLGGLSRTVKSIFSGGYAPISFFPQWFQSIANFLPFIYTRYFPMLIYLNKITIIESIRGIGIQLVWIVVLFILVRKVWKNGLKRYEGVGI